MFAKWRDPWDKILGASVGNRTLNRSGRQKSMAAFPFEDLVFLSDERKGLGAQKWRPMLEAEIGAHSAQKSAETAAWLPQLRFVGVAENSRDGGLTNHGPWEDVKMDPARAEADQWETPGCRRTNPGEVGLCPRKRNETPAN